MDFEDFGLTQLSLVWNIVSMVLSWVYVFSKSHYLLGFHAYHLPLDRVSGIGYHFTIFGLEQARKISISWTGTG